MNGGDVRTVPTVSYSPRLAGGEGCPPASRGLYDSRHLERVEDALQQLLRRDLLGLSLVGDGDAMAQTVGADGLDVLRRNEAAAFEQRLSLRRPCQEDRRPRAGA